MINRFEIMFRHGSYYVSIPNYAGGEVVSAEAHDATISRLTAERDEARKLLKEARQYVSDAGDDEDAETQRLSGELLAEIDAALTTTKSNESGSTTNDVP